MKLSLSRLLVASVAIASIGLASAPPTARATTVVELTLEELTRRSDAIVRARVRRARDRTMTLGGRLQPVTAARLQVVEWWKGEGSASITVITPGGSRPGGRRIVAGAPRYRRGAEVVAFLRREGYHYRTTGMAQGLFRVRPASEEGRLEVLRDPSGVGTIRLSSEDLAARRIEAGEGISLPAFRRAVRSAEAEHRVEGGDR